MQLVFKHPVCAGTDVLLQGLFREFRFGTKCSLTVGASTYRDGVILDAFIESDLSLTNADDAMGIRRNFAFVRHKDDRISFREQFVDPFHHFPARLGIEITRW